MIVIVRMVMIVGVTMSLRLAQPQQTLVEKRRSDGDDGQSGNYSEHRSNFFRHHVIRQEQRSQAEQKDADGVSECNRCAQESRVLHSASRSDQICRDNGFSVSRRKRMGRAEHERHRQAGEHQAEADFLFAEQA